MRAADCTVWWTPKYWPGRQQGRPGCAVVRRDQAPRRAYARRYSFAPDVSTNAVFVLQERLLRSGVPRAEAHQQFLKINEYRLPMQA